jgi:hypothetical protein
MSKIRSGKSSASASPSDAMKKWIQHFDGLQLGKSRKTVLLDSDGRPIKARQKSPDTTGEPVDPSVTQTLKLLGASVERWTADGNQLEPMIRFLLNELPRRVKKSDKLYRDAAQCFAATLSQAWQCGSLFPTHPEDYAAWFRLYLDEKVKSEDSPTNGELWRVGDVGIQIPATPPRTPKPGTAPTPEDIALGAALLLSPDIKGEDKRCGFMPWNAKDPGLIRDSEFNTTFGAVEGLLVNKGKYEEYDKLLKESGFEREWHLIKKHFPTQTKGKDTFHRTLMRERKWQQEDVAKFDTEGSRFQAAFDLLCWKYCLWGVEKGVPVLMRPSVNLTPYGTQIFIPAYMSFDPRRDLDLGYIAQLHSSRGVPRQGAKMSENRIAGRAQAKEFAEAAEDALSENIKGARMIKQVIRVTGKLRGSEESQIRREIAKGRKLKSINGTDS